MPAPLAKGIIITVSVLVAAGIAAYENEAVRQWVERSREKIALAFNMGESRTPSSPRRDDRSMREEEGEKAAERRRQMRDEIMEKGRMMEESRKRRKISKDNVHMEKTRTPSFDTLVDEEGKLRSAVTKDTSVTGLTSAVDSQEQSGTLRSRHVEPSEHAMHESVDSPIMLRQLDGPTAQAIDPWESQYEEEMRNTWNIPIADRTMRASTHASESLIDLTPTTEDFPDPEISVPSVSDVEHPLGRTEYFSIPPSRSSHTLSEAGSGSQYVFAEPDQSLASPEPRPWSPNATTNRPQTSAGSGIGSALHINHDDLDSNDSFSELGDGIRTPASAWTEVGSTVSDDF